MTPSPPLSSPPRWLAPPAAAQPRTIRQAADELNLAPGTLRAWIAHGRIGHIKLGRAIRVPVSEIRRLLDRGYVPPTE